MEYADIFKVLSFQVGTKLQRSEPSPKLILIILVCFDKIHVDHLDDVELLNFSNAGTMTYLI